MNALCVLIGGVLIAAAISDVISLRIPNYLSIALVALFAAYAVMALPLADVLWHMLAGSVVLGVGIALFAFGLVGGGDIKLLAAVTLFVGWSLLLPLLFVIAMIGGVLAVLIVTLRVRGIMRLLTAMGLRGAIFESERAYVPYAVAIVAGWFIVGPFHLL
jgi:prepilin peptidase CpaA